MSVRRRSLASWLSTSAIAGQDESERSADRNRRVIASAVAGLGLRASSLAVVLVTVPLTLGYLGPIRFGLWMTLASLVYLLTVSDLGIGNGVLNTMARAFGRADRTAACSYLSSGIAALSSIAALLGVLFVLAYPITPWGQLYNVAADPLAAAEAGPATAVFVVTFLLGLPLGLVAQARAAFQEGFIQSIFSGVGHLVTLGLLVLAIQAQAGLPLLVIAMTSGPLIAAAINLFVLVRLQRPWLMPRRSAVTVPALRSVIGVGFGFFILQVAYVMAFSSDRLIVAHVAGAAAVADYSVVHRLFAIPAGLAVIATVPLWPAYREAISREDLSWVRRTLRRSALVVLAATVPLGVLLSILGPAIVGIWTADAVTPVYGLYPALAAFTVAYALANVFSMLLNGAQAMRFQISIWVTVAIANVGLSIWLGLLIGVTGVAIASAVTTVAVLILPALAYTPRLLQRLESSRSQINSPIAVDDGATTAARP